MFDAYKKPKIAVLMGGFSSEAPISMNSGKNIFHSVDTKKFTPIKVIISAADWYAEYQGKEYTIDRHSFSFVDEKDTEHHFDAVWNIVHGTPGEDGKIQAYFDLMNIPYTGSGVYPMGISMNKRDCNMILGMYGIQVLPSLKITADNVETELQKVPSRIGFPCIVKPNSSGSSFGMGIAQETESLTKAVTQAMDESSEVIVEKFQRGIEVTGGIIEYKDRLIPLPLTEVIHSGEYFFDTELKYSKDRGVKHITPAVSINDKTTQKIQDTVVKAFQILGLSTHARADFIVEGEEIYFLEINTVPGMSDQSVLPHQIETFGISLTDLISDNLVRVMNTKG